MKKSVLPVLALLAAACEPPPVPTEERIIRIQIEGCKDEPAPTATPIVIFATPPPQPDAQASTGTAGTALAAMSGNAGGSTSGTMSLAAMTTELAPVAPSRPVVDPLALPADPARARVVVLQKRRDLFARLDDRDLAIGDLNAPAIAVKMAEVAFKEGDLENAMRHLEVADQEIRRTNVTQQLVSKRIERVLTRLKRAKLGPETPIWKQRYDEAEKKLAQEGGYLEANRALAAIERDLDLLEAGRQK